MTIEWDEDAPMLPTCRVCGRDLVNRSEVLDDLCVRCFQMREYGRALTAQEMGLVTARPETA